MELPQPRPRGGGVDKYDFYYWLGCQILVLGDSIKGKLVEAIQDGDVRRLKGLVSSMKKNTRAKLAKMNIDRHGLLQLAVFLGKLEVCRYFVEDLSFDVDCSGLCNGATPLGCASLFGEVACARFLLDHGADPNKMDETGSVALHNAAKNGNGELMRLLLSRGARVDIAIPQGTPLHIAASYGNIDAVKILLDHHADPDIISEVSGSPLVSALQSTKLVNESDSLECVKLLIKAGADVNSANPNTPLEVATVNGLTDCIKCLLEAGADPNIAKNQVEKNGKTTKLKLKLDGDKAVRRKNYLAASKLYTQAIELDLDDATLYANRSLCHLRIGEANKALLDANSCIKIRPEWLKGYYRKGVALMSLREYKEACDAFLAGLKLDPTNVDMERMFREVLEATEGSCMLEK
ncbi:ankyrin repeat and protein kinase domain-containing protein 1-like isoform X1 [Sorghum bicolor]|uniref:ankyrin repeat and protein kinase domain-containing protein 1-like isoform X1 n=1 Tax=Sorghum bicolor TaxID=4558 RepID=UPI000B423764|nr:ankyrin repeat and protein kinase domain-containing protein 1-like isoform X1 [Sorghum bicolor]|eukprot:XP_021310041.1 ankyrin repeat and protein kinase domain-containing protein 1-like isoform X1 [Sorghum bicolor]